MIAFKSADLKKILIKKFRFTERCRARGLYATEKWAATE